MRTPRPLVGEGAAPSLPNKRQTAQGCVDRELRRSDRTSPPTFTVRTLRFPSDIRNLWVGSQPKGARPRRTDLGRAFDL